MNALKSQYIVITWDNIEEKTFLENLDEKNIIFFYPKDNTPWCSLENKEFSNFLEEFSKIWIKVIWISKDSQESHLKFISKFELKQSLIVDSELNLHNHFWAYWEKNNYWKIVSWVIRSTYLVNKKWEVLKEWKNIRAKWHVERILKELTS